MVVYHDRNLIINYIPRHLSDSDLSDLFSSAGTIKTCRIIRDHNTGASFGFGFCEYENIESAHRAIERFNGYRIADKILKVSLAKLQGRLYQSSNLYVKNFPTTVTDEQILLEFSRCGKVQQCRILRDRETNASKGSAYVLFETRGDAEAARKHFDGTPWPGAAKDQILSIKFATPPYRQPTSNGISKCTSSVAVTSTETEYDDQLAAQLLALQCRTSYGYDASMNNTGTSFIPDALYLTPGQTVQGTFPLPSNMNPLTTWPSEVSSDSVPMTTPSMPVAPAYLSPIILAQHPPLSGFWTSQPYVNLPMLNMLYNNQLDGITNAVHGCPLYTGFPTPLLPSNGTNPNLLHGFLNGLLQEDAVSRKSKSCKLDRSGNASVYVYNIGNLMTERRLYDLFSRFGIVVSVSIPRDPRTNFTRNFGFVTFNTAQSARSAINSMNGFLYDGRRLQVSLRKPRIGTCRSTNECNSKVCASSNDTSIVNDGERLDSPIESLPENLRDQSVSPTESCVNHVATLRLDEGISGSTLFNDSRHSAIKT